VLTFDARDFVPLAAGWRAAGKDHSGVVVSTQQPISTLVTRARKLLRTLSADDLRNRVVWLNDFR